MAMTYRTESDTFTVTLATPLVRDGSGIIDYSQLTNKPTLNGVEISGDLSLEDLGIQPAGDYPSAALTADDIDHIIGE